MSPRLPNFHRCAYLLPLLLSTTAFALTPDQLALIVNRNVPESMLLAQSYAAARDVPPGRIISLDLPDSEEMSFDDYEKTVVPNVRQFLRDHELNRQVRCLVTFFGVPFRIRDRTNTPPDNVELADLRIQLTGVVAQADPFVTQVEQLARTVDRSFRPPPRAQGESDAQRLTLRYATAVRAISLHLAALSPPSTQPATRPTRSSAVKQFMDLMGKLGGPTELAEHARIIPGAGTIAELQEWSALRQQLLKDAQDAILLEQRRYDPDARAGVRRIIARSFGLLRLAEILESQIDYLTPGNSNSAVDSELSLLWLNYYPRSGPWLNPLNYTSVTPARNLALMVSRLDAPDPGLVSRMISTSIQVEAKGLHGCLAINSFGFPHGLAADGRNLYKEYEQRFRALGQLVRRHGNIPVHEEYTRYFTNQEITQTALYVGWYSLRRYIPGMTFSPGAVGYHIASLEMVGLHSGFETGWVHGLLTDGVVATLGPVAEPYLVGFPPPDEFFPLLMTGKLTLAEAYWKTQPTGSWMTCLIGDPLYTPYKIDPVLKPQDLPSKLQPIVASVASSDSSPPPQ